MIGIELFLLLNDITLFRAPKPELPGITGERIAEVRDQAGGVRWQDHKDVVWNESRAGQPLYEGQSVMTLSDSSARLVFDARDGKSAEIEVGPQTLLQLQAKKSADGRPLLLSLSRGAFRAKTDRALEISAGEFSVHVDAGTRFEAENVDAKRSRSGRASLRLTIREGAARSGTATVARDQVLEVPLLSAEEAARDSTLAPIVLESENLAPSPIPSGEPSSAPSPTSVPTPVPTPRAARVRALPPPRVQAPVIRRRAPPSPAPKAGASIFDFLFPDAAAEETGEGEEWEIELRWESVPNARAYRVEVARTRNFAAPIAKSETSEPHWTWPYRRGMENSKGRIFYRVASIDERGKVGTFSEPKIFNIPTAILHPVAKRAPVETPPPVKSVARAPDPPSDTAWSLRPAAELTSLGETSDFPQLRRVDTGGAYLHESLAFSRLSPALFVDASLRANHFKSDPGILPKSRSYRASLGAERATSWLGGRFFLGASFVFEDHFEKAGPDSIALARGLSVGPSAAYLRPLWSVLFRFPISGAFGKGTLAGPYGPTLHLERDWNVAQFGAGGDRTRLLVSLSAEGSYHLWSTRENVTATVTEWSAGIGPKLILR